MSYTALSLFKSHLGLIHSDDDTLDQQCLDAAEFHCAALMGRRRISDIQDVPWIVSDDSISSDMSDGSATVPATVIQAILMYGADFYENRQMASPGSFYRNPAADALLHFQRIGLGV